MEGMNAQYLLGDAITGFPRRLTTFGTTVPRFGEQHRACGREILRLTSENVALREDLERERVINQDLGKSATMWIRLYEQQLARANALASQAAGPRGEDS